MKENILYPRGVESARMIQVIETKSARGSGVKEQPVRTVTEYWSLEGEKLAENDPYLREIASASSVDQQRTKESAQDSA